MKVRGLQCGLALSCGLLAVGAQGATLEKGVAQPFVDADHVVYFWRAAFRGCRPRRS